MFCAIHIADAFNVRGLVWAVPQLPDIHVLVALEARSKSAHDRIMGANLALTGIVISC
jgi:hypothetical protein